MTETSFDPVLGSLVSLVCLLFLSSLRHHPQLTPPHLFAYPPAYSQMMSALVLVSHGVVYLVPAVIHVPDQEVHVPELARVEPMLLFVAIFVVGLVSLSVVVATLVVMMPVVATLISLVLPDVVLQVALQPGSFQLHVIQSCFSEFPCAHRLKSPLQSCSEMQQQGSCLFGLRFSGIVCYAYEHFHTEHLGW